MFLFFFLLYTFVLITRKRFVSLPPARPINPMRIYVLNENKLDKRYSEPIEFTISRTINVIQIRKFQKHVVLIENHWHHRTRMKKGASVT